MMSPAEQALRKELETGDPAKGFAVNYLVEAGAGAGKTYTMIQRMANQLVAGCDPRNMVAITFTVKSTQEMQQRLDQELRDRRAAATAPQDIQRLEQLIREVGQMQISTIHGFCQTLLDTMPFQSPLGAEMTLLEDDKARCESYFQRRYLQDPRLFTQCSTQFDLWSEQYEEAFYALCHHTDCQQVYEPVGSPAYQKNEQELDQTAQLLHQKLHSLLTADPACQNFLVPELVQLALQPASAFHNAQDLCTKLFAIVRGDPDKLTVKGQTKAPSWKDFKAEWDLIVETIQVFRDLAAQIIHSLCMNDLLPLVKDYRQELLDQHIATYDDLLLFARNMLRDNPQAREYFHQRYQVLFVDEFQDSATCFAMKSCKYSAA